MDNCVQGGNNEKKGEEEVRWSVVGEEEGYR